MKKIYISGQMTGIKNYNKKAFMKAEKYLHKKGYKTVNPYRLSKMLNKIKNNPTYADYLRHDLEWLKKCDSIYMLENWENSNGAKTEIDKAHELGLQIYFESEVF